jgi:hypothetical protein
MSILSVPKEYRFLFELERLEMKFTVSLFLMKKGEKQMNRHAGSFVIKERRVYKPSFILSKLQP